MPDEAAQHWGHRETLYHEGQRWSFNEFQQEVNRTAKGLISLGVPDSRLSEVACACVVLKPGQAVSNEDLVTFCRGRLASFKIPEYTVVMDEFPMTASGKVQKFLLRKMAVAEAGLPKAAPVETA